MIGDKIKARREELGMTQQQLADKMGYSSRSSINKIESNLQDIPQKKIMQFAKELNTTVEYLMDWDELGTELRKILHHIANKLNKDYSEIKKLFLDGSINSGGKVLTLNYPNLLKAYENYYHIHSAQPIVDFATVEDAMQFIIQSPVVSAYGGYDLDKMSDDEIIDFANELSEIFKVIAERRRK